MNLVIILLAVVCFILDDVLSDVPLSVVLLLNLVTTFLTGVFYIEGYALQCSVKCSSFIKYSHNSSSSCVFNIEGCTCDVPLSEIHLLNLVTTHMSVVCFILKDIH